MKKVYILIHEYDYESTSILSVHASLPGAQAAMRREADSYTGDYVRWDSRDDMFIKSSNTGQTYNIVEEELQA